MDNKAFLELQEKYDRLLTENDEMYLLLQSIPDIFYKLDINGNFTFLSDLITEIGYEPDELIGQHFSTLLHPDDIPKVSREKALPFYKGTNTGKNSPKLFDERRSWDRRTENLEVRIVRKNNNKSFIGSVTAFGEVSSAGFYKVEKNEFIGTIGIIRDISDRKEMENYLRKFYLAIDQNPDSIVMTDIKGNIEYFNSQFIQTSGYYPDELIGKNISLIKSGTHSKKFYSDLWETINSGNFWKGEMRNKRKNGELYLDSTKIIPIKNENDEITDFVAIKIDVSNEYAEKVKIEKLEKKQKMMKEIQHRVQNSLQIIIGLLRFQTAKIKNIESLEAFQKFENRIRVLSTVYERYYNASDGTNVDVGDLLNSLLVNISRARIVTSKTIKFEKSITKNFVDFELIFPLGLIFNELITNAMKHGLNDKSESKIFINFYEENNYYFLKIKDEGDGIPEDFNIDACDTLGLKLVKTLTEQLSGLFELKNSNGTEAILKFCK